LAGPQRSRSSLLSVVLLSYPVPRGSWPRVSCSSTPEADLHDHRRCPRKPRGASKPTAACLSSSAKPSGSPCPKPRGSFAQGVSPAPTPAAPPVILTLAAISRPWSYKASLTEPSARRLRSLPTTATRAPAERTYRPSRTSTLISMASSPISIPACALSGLSPIPLPQPPPLPPSADRSARRQTPYAADHPCLRLLPNPAPRRRRRYSR